MTSIATQLDAALRSADPGPAALTADDRSVRDALRARILATPRNPGATRARVPAGARRRRTLRRAAPAVASVCLLAIGGQLVFDSAPDAAAAWTATAEPVDPATAKSAQDQCVDDMGRALRQDSDVPKAYAPTVDMNTVRAVVTERRGSTVFVALAAPDGSTFRCLSQPGHPFAGRMMGGGFATASSTVPQLAADQLDATSLGSSSHGAESFMNVQGRVGSAVRGVTIHASGLDTQATVSGGYFAAWWPAPGIHVRPDRGAVSYDLTLADGTVLYAVKPVR